MKISRVVASPSHCAWKNKIRIGSDADQLSNPPPHPPLSLPLYRITQGSLESWETSGCGCRTWKFSALSLWHIAKRIDTCGDVKSLPRQKIGHPDGERGWRPHHTAGTAAVYTSIIEWTQHNGASGRLQTNLCKEQPVTNWLVLPSPPPGTHTRYTWIPGTIPDKGHSGHSDHVYYSMTLHPWTI